MVPLFLIPDVHGISFERAENFRTEILNIIVKKVMKGINEGQSRPRMLAVYITTTG